MKQYIFRLTASEVDALAYLVGQGYGEGDAEDNRPTQMVRAIRRVRKKVSSARCSSLLDRRRKQG